MQRHLRNVHSIGSISNIRSLVTLNAKMPGTFDIATARQRFPALKEDQVYLDNAGGSQVLGDVIDSYIFPSDLQAPY